MEVGQGHFGGRRLDVPDFGRVLGFAEALPPNCSLHHSFFQQCILSARGRPFHRGRTDRLSGGVPDWGALVPCILPSVISTGWIRVRLRRVPNKTRRSSLAGSGGRAWVVLGWLHVNSWVFIAETFGKAVSSLRPVAVVRRQKPVWRRASRLPGLGRGMSKVSVMVNLCDKAGRPNSRSGDPKVTNITKEG